jgi:trimethylamine--corrinoid protein Co-methyltransferase
MTINEKALAIDVIRDIGPGGEFVTHPHTLHHFHDVWYSDLLFRGGSRAWDESGLMTFEGRVNARTRELIEFHQPEPLPDEIVEQIEDILGRAEE